LALVNPRHRLGRADLVNPGVLLVLRDQALPWFLGIQWPRLYHDHLLVLEVLQVLVDLFHPGVHYLLFLLVDHWLPVLQRTRVLPEVLVIPLAPGFPCCPEDLEALADR